MTHLDPSAEKTAALIETLRANGGPRNFPQTTDYQEVINEAEMCLDSIQRLAMMCPLEALADYAEDRGFPPEIAQGFRNLEAPACPIVHDGPELIYDFLNGLARQGDPDKDLSRSPQRKQLFTNRIEGATDV